jgi:hypothetical protein
MALRELRDSALLNVLKNDSSRRDWAVQDSANDVQLPPAPDTWSVVSSTVEAVARGGINLVTRVAERLTSPRPNVLQSPTVPTVPAGPALDPDGPDGDADDELKEVGIMYFFVGMGKRREKKNVIVTFSHGSIAVALGGGGGENVKNAQIVPYFVFFCSICGRSSGLASPHSRRRSRRYRGMA